MSVAVVVNGAVSFSTLSGSVTRRLNQPSSGKFKVPLAYSNLVTVGDKVQIYIDSLIALNGRVTFWEIDTEEDGGFCEASITDPMEIWKMRPARDDTGDYTKPTFIEDYVTGPAIMESILKNSEGDSTAQGNPGLTPPGSAEGPLDITIGTVEGGGVDLTGAPTDWPMNIDEVGQLLVSTGQLDIVCAPLDELSLPVMATVGLYNGDYGTDLSGAFSLDYGVGNLNVQKLKWTKDLSTVDNKLRYLLGPRVLTSTDLAGDQHWRASVEGTDSGLADPPRTAVLARRAGSQTDYGVRSKISIFDGDGESAFRELFRWQWLAESYADALPREIIIVTPSPGTIPWGTFGEGDIVGVSAHADVAGGFTGAQRIYEFTGSWDDNSVVTISELQTSPQNDGFTT